MPPHFLINNWRRRFFQNLLVPPLDGTLALSQVNRVSMLVSQDLHFDVSRVNHRLLDIDFTISERALRFALRRLQRQFQLAGRMHQAHTLPTAARSSLEHYGEADLRSDAFRFRERLESARSARHQRHSSFLHRLPRPRFRAHHLHRSRGWAHELHSYVGTRLRELCILRQKPIAGMDGIGASSLCYFKNLVDV